MSELYWSELEVANYFGRTKKTVKLWVEKGILTPANTDTYRSDGGYRFTLAEIERIKKLERSKDFLSLKDASEYIGISEQYLCTLAIKKEIETEEGSFADPRRRFVHIEECNRFRQLILQRRHTKYMRFAGQKLNLFEQGIRLFDSFIYHEKQAVIILLSPLKLLVDGEGILEPTEKVVFSSKPIKEIPYMRTKGAGVFQFELTHDVYSPIFPIMSKLIESLGDKNVRITINEGKYIVKCRRGYFEGTNEEFKMLLKHQVSGDVYMRGNVIHVGGELKTRPFNIEIDLFKLLETEASKSNKPIDIILNEWLRAYVEQHNYFK